MSPLDAYNSPFRGPPASCFASNPNTQQLLKLKPDRVHLLSRNQPMASIKLRIKPTLLSLAHRVLCDAAASPPPPSLHPCQLPTLQVIRAPYSPPKHTPTYSCLRVFGLSVPSARSSVPTDVLLSAHSQLRALPPSSFSLKPPSTRSEMRVGGSGVNLGGSCQNPQDPR